MRYVGISFQISLAIVFTIVISLVSQITLIHHADAARKQTASTLHTLVSKQLIAREIQVNFKKQVQEWKNILLRGNSDKDLDLYTESFESLEAKVAVGIDSLLSVKPSSEIEIQLLAIQNNLAIIGEEYRAALVVYKKNVAAKKVYPSSTINPAALADSMVRGTDRATTELLDNIIVSYEQQVSDMISMEDAQIQSELKSILSISILIYTLLIIIYSVFISRRVVKPIRSLTEYAQSLSDNMNNLQVPYVERNDEIGVMAKALQIFRRNRISELALQRSAKMSVEAQEKEHLHALQAEIEAQRCEAEKREQRHQEELMSASIQREEELHRRISLLSTAVVAASEGDFHYLKNNRDHLCTDDDLGVMIDHLENLFTQLASDFERISTDSEYLGKAAENLGDLSRAINDDAHQNTEQSQEVINAVGNVRATIKRMAKELETMADGICTIDDSATQASNVADQAVRLAQETNDTMRKLSSSSNDIDNVVKLINSVAEQTNLLALNATIEAARAGDAGKGFAVVANEVKELAKETNKATEEIQHRIDTIRTDTDLAVDAIHNINDIVSQINEFQLHISESVRKQSSTADGILDAVSTTLNGNKRVRGLITAVNQRQSSSQESAQEVFIASQNLKKSADNNSELAARYAHRT